MSFFFIKVAKRTPYLSKYVRILLALFSGSLFSKEQLQLLPDRIINGLLALTESSTGLSNPI
jgi:hypothetical protein